MESLLVEAIEGGKIVLVPKDYAIKENLVIVKKRQSDLPFAAYPDDAQKVSAETVFKETPYYLKNDLMSELKDNFHWELQKQRKLRNLTRRQLSKLSSIEERDIAELEAGNTPTNFIILSKLEAFYGINLRD